ncbi:MAG: ATP-binding cassette domain-containing protein [Tissierellia bacterium]|nr:ATP-binding cassette domain-containing protein [Tissierellia bacterium]
MLELENICFEVNNGEKQILKNINLKLDDNFIVITGPNGSGKSTLAKIIAGIVKPTSGRIILDGIDITDFNPTEKAKAGISFAFQQPVRFKGITVRDLITLAAGKDLTFHETCKYLSDVGLCAKDYVNREVDDSLSGGELKRIEVATVMARETKFSIFDEPEAGIDLWSFQNLISVFKDLNKSTGGSILVISHQERIIDIADKIILLDSGEVAEIGSKDEVLPKLKERYLVENKGEFC